MSFLAYKANGPRNIQYPETVLGRVYVVYENVSGKKGNPNPFFTVFPPAEYLAHRKEYFNTPVRQLAQHLFFKTAAGVQRVPFRFYQSAPVRLFQNRRVRIVRSNNHEFLGDDQSTIPLRRTIEWGSTPAHPGEPDSGLTIAGDKFTVKQGRGTVPGICPRYLFESLSLPVFGLHFYLDVCRAGGIVTAAVIADASDRRAIESAAQIIRRGGLVAFPTETVYGLGADAGNPLAVAGIFDVKARPRIDPVIVHVADPASAEYYGRFPAYARPIMSHFWPGPLTLVVEKTPAVPPIVTAGLDTVAIRIPSHPAALGLIRAAGRGIAAPSANLFGYVSPTTAQHVADQLSDKIDLILDGGPCAIGVESTILSLAGRVPCILRAGGIPVEELRSLIGDLDLLIDTTQRPVVPGQMRRHYATQTRLLISEQETEELNPEERAGLLSLLPPENPHKYAAVEVLSPSGNLKEAAANLFVALRRLDSLSLDKIIARPMPEEGLGLAIMDRLRRCSAD